MSNSLITLTKRQKILSYRNLYTCVYMWVCELTTESSWQSTTTTTNLHNRSWEMWLLLKTVTLKIKYMWCWKIGNGTQKAFVFKRTRMKEENVICTYKKKQKKNTFFGSRPSVAIPATEIDTDFPEILMSSHQLWCRSAGMKAQNSFPNPRCDNL